MTTISILSTCNLHVKRVIALPPFLVSCLLRMRRTLNWGVCRPQSPPGPFGADKKVLRRDSTDRRNTKVAYTKKNLSVTLSTTNPTSIDLASYPGPRKGRWLRAGPRKCSSLHLTSRATRHNFNRRHPVVFLLSTSVLLRLSTTTIHNHKYISRGYMFRFLSTIFRPLFTIWRYIQWALFFSYTGV